MKMMNVYVCQFKFDDGTDSKPMAIFTNKKAAEEYVYDKNMNDELYRWYYYKTNAFSEYFWRTGKTL